jgi:hypothetical protein
LVGRSGTTFVLPAGEVEGFLRLATAHRLECFEVPTDERTDFGRADLPEHFA